MILYEEGKALLFPRGEDGRFAPTPVAILGPSGQEDQSPLAGMRFSTRDTNGDRVLDLLLSDRHTKLRFKPCGHFGRRPGPIELSDKPVFGLAESKEIAGDGVLYDHIRHTVNFGVGGNQIGSELGE